MSAVSDEIIKIESDGFKSSVFTHLKQFTNFVTSQFFAQENIDLDYENFVLQHDNEENSGFFGWAYPDEVYDLFDE